MPIEQLMLLHETHTKSILTFLGMCSHLQLQKHPFGWFGIERYQQQLRFYQFSSSNLQSGQALAIVQRVETTMRFQL